MGDILFLAHRVPFPPNRGDKIRAHHLLRKLSKLARVHVGCFAENDEDRAAATQLEQIATTHRIIDRTKPLTLAGVEAILRGKPVSLTAFHSAKIDEWVRATIAEYAVDAIVIFSGQMGQYVPDDFQGRVVIDLCDVDSAKFENYADAGKKVWLNRRESRLLSREENTLANRADATVLISDAEASLFQSRLAQSNCANVQVLGNGIDAQFFNPTSIVPEPSIHSLPGPHFVFTGQMDYSPNEAAAMWAIKSFMPAIRELYPSASIHVVGRNPTRALMQEDGKGGVCIWGEVPDVRPFIAAATFVLAPLQIARGVQNKVLEAMAMARPVLLTPQAATGISAMDGLHWLLSEADPAQMCSRIEALMADDDAAFDLGSAARQFVLDHHDWDTMLSPLKALVIGNDQEGRDAT